MTMTWPGWSQSQTHTREVAFEWEVTLWQCMKSDIYIKISVWTSGHWGSLKRTLHSQTHSVIIIAVSSLGKVTMVKSSHRDCPWELRCAFCSVLSKMSCYFSHFVNQLIRLIDTWPIGITFSAQSVSSGVRETGQVISVVCTCQSREGGPVVVPRQESSSSPRRCLSSSRFT